MEYIKYTKEEALIISKDFIKDVIILQKKYGLTLNSDTGDIYLSFKFKKPKNSHWGTISLGWDGDGSEIKVTEKTEQEVLKQQALAKLSKKDREVLGL